MNRRNFLQLAGLGFLSILIPQWENGNEMDLADIGEKLANQARLTPQEMDFWKNSLRETQLRNSFVAGNTSPQNTLLHDFPFGVIFSERFGENKTQFILNIPPDYKHLIMFSDGRVTDTSPGGAIWTIAGSINGDEGANYGRQTLGGNNSTPYSEANTGYTYFGLGYLLGDDAASGRTISNIVFIPNYRSSFYKRCIFLSGFDSYMIVSTSFWNNTNPINTITIVVGTSIKAGSAFSVYGIK